MDNTWPPPAPDVSKDFNKVRHEQPSEKKEPASNPIITKQEIDQLVKLVKTTLPQPVLTPTGARLANKKDRDQIARLERMQKRMKELKEKTHADFNKSAERER